MRTKVLLAAFCLLATSLLLIGCGGKEQKPASKTSDTTYTVGLLMETYDLDRWKRDETFFSDKCRSLGMTVLRAVADGDQDRQNKLSSLDSPDQKRSLAETEIRHTAK